MKRKTNTLFSTPTLSTIAALVIAGALFAQPVEPPSQGDQPPNRQRIEQRLERLHKEQDRLRTALERLENPQGSPADQRSIDKRSPHRADSEKSKNRVTEPMRQRAIKVLQAVNPELYNRWRQLQKNDPERARQMGVHLIERMRKNPQTRRMLALLETDPAQFDRRAQQYALDRQAFASARRYVKAIAQDDQATADASRAQVRTLLEQQINAWFEEQRQTLERSEQRLTKLRAEIEEQSSRREALIDQRFKNVIRRAMRQKKPRQAPEVDQHFRAQKETPHR